MDMKWFEDAEACIPHGEVRSRFAPSPTGYMHVGNLRTALYTYLIAKKDNGRFILRIEDTDQDRLVDGATELIYKTLKDCRLDYDEGPDIGGPVGPYIQTERREIYVKYAELLLEKGGAYRCFCEKTDVQEGEQFVRREDPCRKLSEDDIKNKLKAGATFVIRQKIPHDGSTTFHDEIFGDIIVPNDTLDDSVLMKSDGLPTYNFANVIDDHLMGITHVVRGSEYLASSPKYNLLYESFGWEIPKYLHCAPVMRDHSNKMSKRYGDPSYEDLLVQGYLSGAILNYVALLGWSPGGEQEIFSLEELCKVFDIKGISKSPAIFDFEKLRYFNAEYIRAMEPGEFIKIAEPYIRKSVKNLSVNLEELASLLQPRCEKLTDIPEKVDFFDALSDYDLELYTNKKSKTNREISLQMLREVLFVLSEIENWTYDEIHAVLISAAEKTGVKNATLMWPLRIALAGKLVTPGGAVEISKILGREETIKRINAGIKRLEKSVCKI